MTFRSFGLSDVGLVRQRNEDAFLDRPDLGLWAVADGMGGHDAGDEASAAIVAALERIAPPADLEDFVDEVKKQLTLVDRDLRTRAASLGPLATVASTAVALLVYGGDFACVWAGDSRLYLLRDGELRQVSTDHSRVQELIDSGLLSPEDAAAHPEAHVVTQAIGGGLLAFGTRVGIVRPGDVFLLCSDGLTNVLADNEIARELGGVAPQPAAGRLRDLVLAGGAPDNVTVVVVAAG